MRNILLISIIFLFSSCILLQETSEISYSTNQIQNRQEKVKEGNDEVVEKIIPFLSLGSKENLSITKDAMGDYTIRDGNGKRTTISKDIIGDYTIRDSDGNRTTISKDIIGDYTIRDNNGNRTTIRKDIMGNYIIRDSDGKSTTISKDVVGDNTIEKIIVSMGLLK